MTRNQISLKYAQFHQLGHNRRTCKSNQRTLGEATAKSKGKAALEKGKDKVATDKDYFMGFRVQVDGAFSSQQSNVCVIYARLSKLGSYIGSLKVGGIVNRRIRS